MTPWTHIMPGKTAVSAPPTVFRVEFQTANCRRVLALGKTLRHLAVIWYKPPLSVQLS